MDDNDSLSSRLQHSQESLTLEDARSKTSTSGQQLSQLSHKDDKMYQKIQELNIKGTIQYRSDHHTEALVYFQQCEKILEYAASCGSSIDCSYILTVLHNQAATYQALNQIDKASSYVEAIIYNLVMFLDRSEHIEVVGRLQQFCATDSPGAAGPEFIRQNYQTIRVYLMRKYELGLYYLQFSGLNSQSQMHNQSLKNARKSFQTLRQLCLLCYQYECLLQSSNTYGKQLLRELSGLKVEFKPHQLIILRQQLKKLSAVPQDNDQIYHHSYEQLPLQKRIEIQETNVHSLFDLKAQSIAESITDQSSLHDYNIELCSSDFLHVKKVLALMGAYFAIGVELEEIYGLNSESADHSLIFQQEKKNHKNEAEMTLLAALNLGYKYIPVSTELTDYLHNLYDSNYSKRQAEGIGSLRDFATSESFEKSQEQIDESIVRQYKQEALPVQSNEAAMKMSINILTQKYRQYLVDRDLDFGENSESVSVCAPQTTKAKERAPVEQQRQTLWQQEKKQSKKLAELFKNENPTPATTLLKPSYLNDVASIDSISIANSHSAQQSMPQSKREQQAEFKAGNKKVKLHNLKVSKQIPECSSDIQEGTSGDQKSSEMADKSKRVHFLKLKKLDSQSFRKSKSTKVLKSKSKQLPKDLRMAFTQRTIPSIHEVTSTDKSNTRIKAKKSQSRNKANQHTDLTKLIGSEKKIFDHSNSHKLVKGFNSTRSIKDNLNSIKFHRVKSPNKIPAKPDNLQSRQPKTSQAHALQMLTSIKDKPTKSKSKQKNTSVGSKKQLSKNKSLSGKKNLLKTVKAQPTIYTSSSTNIKRR